MTPHLDPLEKFADHIHLQIIQNPTYIGQNVYHILDLDVLTAWWKAGQWLDTTSDNSFRTKRLKEFHSAVWIQINKLHTKPLLRFRDIE